MSAWCRNGGHPYNPIKAHAVNGAKLTQNSENELQTFAHDVGPIVEPGARSGVRVRRAHFGPKWNWLLAVHDHFLHELRKSVTDKS
jgi:hypothetical protein